MKFLIRSLIVCAALAVAWMVVAGVGGYQIGTPSILDPCVRTMRVDLVIPMWKAEPVSACLGGSSVAGIWDTSTSRPPPVTTTTAEAPPPPATTAEAAAPPCPAVTPQDYLPPGGVGKCPGVPVGQPCC
jgi:hypothetical protein